MAGFFFWGYMAEAVEQLQQAPTFAKPVPVDFDEEQGKAIAANAVKRHTAGVTARRNFAGRHLVYDQQFRGKVEEFSLRDGPWPGSSHLHVPMPYWLVDAIQARLVHGIWSQNPLVQGVWQENDDREKATDAAALIEWNLQPKRMNAHEMWARASKIRLIHGVGVLGLFYVHDKYSYRVSGREKIQYNPSGTPIVDDEGYAVIRPGTDVVEGTYYRGPTLYPYEWDDIVAPIGCMNLQPRRLKNPGGAQWVICRQYEDYLSMKKKSIGDDAEEQAPIYPNMFTGEKDHEWWMDNVPDQLRTSDGDSGSEERVGQHDVIEGANRSQAHTGTTTEDEDTIPDNPEFQILVDYSVLTDPESKEDVEMVSFICKNPEVHLGSYLLSDILWTGERPLIDLHYQMISNRFYSLGVCEIAEHLSDELDTIHNMRVDVGFATNMPFYFVRSASNINANNIVLKPLKLIHVDNPNEVVAGGGRMNVTSFYHAEENLLLSIIERVMGVTDLFLGMSPTRGASARHATGFLGQQQEAEARMAQPMAQDAKSFSDMCRMIYAMEVAYGPAERSFRLEGEDSSIQKTGLTRDDLWFRGQYDFKLGANVGMFSQQFRYQKANMAYNIGLQNPLVTQDMGRIWELTAEVYRAMGYREGEIETFIGPKRAVSAGIPKDQDEENAQMVEFIHGANQPAPVNPADNDQLHLQKVQEFLQSDIYTSLGRPNEPGFWQHILLHNQQIQAKQQQQQLQQQANQQQQQQQQQQPGTGQGASPENRAAAQLQNVPSAGGAANFADTYSQQTNNGGVQPPNFG